MMLACLAAHAMGEMTGYLSGSGRAVQEQIKYEIHRDSYLRSSETTPSPPPAAEPSGRP